MRNFDLELKWLKIRDQFMGIFQLFSGENNTLAKYPLIYKV